MYRAFFGLGEAPFRITPDPRFLHLDPAVEAALARSAAGIAERAGLVLLVGEVGTGKTTLVRRLLDTLPAEVRTVLVLHPTVGFEEILDHVLLELGVPVAGGGPDVLLERLAEFLREHARDGGTVAVFFDEAQALRDVDARRAPAPARPGRATTAGRRCRSSWRGSPSWTPGSPLPTLAPLRARVRVTARLAPLSPDGRGGLRARPPRARAGAAIRTSSPPTRSSAWRRHSQGVPRRDQRALRVGAGGGVRGGPAAHRRGPLIEAVVGRLRAAARAAGHPDARAAARRVAHRDGAAPAPDAGAAQPSSCSRWRRSPWPSIALVPLLATRPWRGDATVPPAPRRAAATPASAGRPEPRPRRTPSRAASRPVATRADGAGEPPRRSPRDVPAARASRRPRRSTRSRSSIASGRPTTRVTPTRCARSSRPTRRRPAPVLDVDPTGGGALVTPGAGIEAKPVGDRVTVRVPFQLSTRDDRGRAVRRQGVASLQVATHDGDARIVALAAESGPVPRR